MDAQTTLVWFSLDEMNSLQPLYGGMRECPAPSIQGLNVFSSIGSPRCLISGSGLKGRRMSKPYLRPFKPSRCALPVNPFASRMLQRQGRRFSGEEVSQGLAEIRIVVVPIHAFKIAPSIDCEEFEGLGHSWLSESEVHVM